MIGQIGAAVGAGLVLVACSGARPTTKPIETGSAVPTTTTNTTTTVGFQPSVTVVLTPSTTVAQIVEAPPEPDVTLALPPVPAADITPVTMAFRPMPGSTGILVTEALGAQPITTSLDSGVLVEGQAGCSVLLSGHRTSGIAPLHDVPDVRTGDPLELQFRDGPTCRYEVRSLELVTEGEAFRRVNLFSAADQAALYTCADPNGEPGGLSHRWWVGLSVVTA